MGGFEQQLRETEGEEQKGPRGLGRVVSEGAQLGVAPVSICDFVQ